MKAKKLGANPKDLIGIKKTRLNLIPPSSMVFQAMSMEDGGDKYGPFNWRENEVIASIYLAAAMRHLLRWLDGEEIARDSRVPHLGHALGCIGIVVDAQTSGNLIDDRPQMGPAGELLDFFTNREAKDIETIEEFLRDLNGRFPKKQPSKRTAKRPKLGTKKHHNKLRKSLGGAPEMNAETYFLIFIAGICVIGTLTMIGFWGI